jgi:beta-galactosidase
MKRILRIILSVLLISQTGLSFAKDNPNSFRLINNWEFVKGDIASTWEAFRPLKQSSLPTWTPVTLPHCFNALDAVDPDAAYYQGPGWYRTYLTINNPFSKGRTILHFEGAGQKTEVYLYQTLVRKHVGGYDEFSIDITAAIEKYLAKFPESENIPIAVRCDNSRDAEMIPSDLSDFNVYGGLYRYVNLVYLPEQSFENIHVDYIIDSTFESVDVKISASLKNKNKALKNISIDFKIKNKEGKLVASHSSKENNWEDIKTFPTIKIESPELWHPNQPNLYTLESSLTINNTSYTETQNIGFKQIEFKEKGPFFINNERLLLRGTHRHEDHAGVAAAMTETLIREEMILMKSMGVNFIRLGHYQQSPIVLNLCDSLGILVWEEIPWCRGGLGGEIYKEQAKRMLTNMITQHYNHPSIIIWGLGNENDWPGDFDTFDKEKIREFMSELNDLSHALDNKRKTAIRRCDFCKDILDVYSPSIWAGWYRGQYINYKEVSYQEAQTVNHFLHVEWGASNHAGRHSENPDIGLDQIKSSGADERDGDFLMSGGSARVSKDGDWSETYACNLIDWHLKEQETMDWLTGAAYWPFKDFSTPLRPENPVPYVNQKGVVQRDLRPKEAFYVFQSYWTEEPMAHIYGHTWETRWGQPDENKLLKIYSNCEEVELFLNGKSLGKRTRNSQDFPAAGLKWKTSFQEGVNQVRVIGTKDDVTVSDEISFTYQIENWGTPNTLKLKELSRERDIITAEVKVYDRDGKFCPDAKNLIEFSIAGDANLIDNMGTWDGSRKIQLYNGRAMIKLQLTGEIATLGASSESLKTSLLQLNTK